MALGSRVDQLLKRLGFRENPFSLREADREGRDRLASYFFQHQLFLDVLGSADSPESVILFAERGGGKTTFRQAIELYCREQRRPVDRVLDVAYTDFSRPMRRAQRRGQEVDIFLHVEEILRCAVARLLASLDEVRVRDFAALPTGEFATLSAYVHRYSALLRAEDYGRTLHALLRRIADENEVSLSDDPALDPSGLLGAEGERIVQLLSPLLQPVARLLIRLHKQPPRPLDQTSYHQLMRDFVDLLLALDYRALYILVDRLDETSLLPTPEAVTRFVAPLLTDIKLLDEHNLAFKIFLPQHLDTYLGQSVDLRRKRLTVRHLAWSGDDLLSLLARRLQTFNNAGISSMQAFCEPSLASRMVRYSSVYPQARYVDVALVQASDNLPRNLILRCRQLFEVYEARNSRGLITEEDLAQLARMPLPAETPPLAATPVTLPPAASGPVGPIPPPAIPQRGLFLDANQHLWRDGQRLTVELSPTEFRLLKYLMDHRYQLCYWEDVLTAIWGAAQTMDTLRQTLKRLRALVEYNPQAPRFLVTRRGLGVQLEDG